MTGRRAWGRGSTKRANIRRGANMKKRLAYKVSVEAAVMTTAFLAGWSSDGIIAGLVASVALGAGVFIPVFRGGR
jgi:hypothetical protein